MSRHLFVSFVLFFTLCILASYFTLYDHYVGQTAYRQNVKEMSARLEHSRFLEKLAYYQLHDFRREVAELLPSEIKPKEENYLLRNLASVVRPTSNIAIDLMKSKNFFWRAKKSYTKGSFLEAADLFDRFIDKHPYSVHIVEAYYLQAESYYKLNQFAHCIEVVEKMVELYPSNELTGFSLIRMGAIFEMQNRSEEAIHLYQTVLRSFSYHAVARQARQSLQDVSL